MIQLRQSALLAGESFAARGRKPRVAQNFNCNQLAQVSALGQVHHAHSTFAEHLLDPVRSEFVERE